MRVAKLKEAYPTAKVQMWCEDEHRLGIKPILRRAWGPIGQRPPAKVHQRYEWTYLYAFARPNTGEVYWLAPSASSSTADPPFPSPPSGSRKTLAPRPEPPANARPGSDQRQRVRCLCGSARQDGGSEGVPNSCAQRSKSGTVIHREPLSTEPAWCSLLKDPRLFGRGCLTRRRVCVSCFAYGKAVRMAQQQRYAGA